LDPNTPRDYEVIRSLESDGFTDYVAIPFQFLSGEVHVATFATRAPEGFDERHIAAMMRLCRPLSRLAEILALRRTATNLLDAYVGRNAGSRIFAGNIRRGDVERLQAIVWFSDLRGFTAMSGEVSAEKLVATLNDVFDCQVPAIQRNGGEVLKFIGDGLLAIFPMGSEGVGPEERCEAALRAVDQAFVALAELNAKRRELTEAPLSIGLALHAGEVAYGNIGGGGRLDFTCIGPVVNVASRMEGLTSKLGRRFVVSAEVAKLSRRPLVSLGKHELKGVALAEEVFAPPAE
jgi:adenylate cyclase